MLTCDNSLSPLGPWTLAWDMWRLCKLIHDFVNEGTLVKQVPYNIED